MSRKFKAKGSDGCYLRKKRDKVVIIQRKGSEKIYCNICGRSRSSKIRACSHCFKQQRKKEDF